MSLHEFYCESCDEQTEIREKHKVDKVSWQTELIYYGRPNNNNNNDKNKPVLRLPVRQNPSLHCT